MVLRSGASSPAARAFGYCIATACVGLFVYMLVVVLVAALDANDTGVWFWAGVWSVVPLAVTVVLSVYVVRQPHTGGYALVGTASLVGAFMCMMAILPLALW